MPVDQKLADVSEGAKIYNRGLVETPQIADEPRV
jgi:hypothetical protein